MKKHTHRRKENSNTKAGGANETKSRRVQLLVRPGVFHAVRKKAEKTGISTNEAIHQAMERYVGTE